MAISDAFLTYLNQMGHDITAPGNIPQWFWNNILEDLEKEFIASAKPFNDVKLDEAIEAGLYFGNEYADLPGAFGMQVDLSPKSLKEWRSNPTAKAKAVIGKWNNSIYNKDDLEATFFRNQVMGPIIFGKDTSEAGIIGGFGKGLVSRFSNFTQEGIRGSSDKDALSMSNIGVSIGGTETVFVREDPPGLVKTPGYEEVDGVFYKVEKRPAQTDAYQQVGVSLMDYAAKEKNLTARKDAVTGVEKSLIAATQADARRAVEDALGTTIKAKDNVEFVKKAREALANAGVTTVVGVTDPNTLKALYGLDYIARAEVSKGIQDTLTQVKDTATPFNKDFFRDFFVDDTVIGDTFIKSDAERRQITATENAALKKKINEAYAEVERQELYIRALRGVLTDEDKKKDPNLVFLEIPKNDTKDRFTDEIKAYEKYLADFKKVLDPSKSVKDVRLMDAQGNPVSDKKGNPVFVREISLPPAIESGDRLQRRMAIEGFSERMKTLQTRVNNTGPFKNVQDTYNSSLLKHDLLEDYDPVTGEGSDLNRHVFTDTDKGVQRSKTWMRYVYQTSEFQEMRDFVEDLEGGKIIEKYVWNRYLKSRVANYTPAGVTKAYLTNLNFFGLVSSASPKAGKAALPVFDNLELLLAKAQYKRAKKNGSTKYDDYQDASLHEVTLAQVRLAKKKRDDALGIKRKPAHAKFLQKHSFSISSPELRQAFKQLSLDTDVLNQVEARKGFEFAGALFKELTRKPLKFSASDVLEFTGNYENASQITFANLNRPDLLIRLLNGDIPQGAQLPPDVVKNLNDFREWLKSANLIGADGRVIAGGEQAVFGVLRALNIRDTNPRMIPSSKMYIGLLDKLAEKYNIAQIDLLNGDINWFALLISPKRYATAYLKDRPMAMARSMVYARIRMRLGGKALSEVVSKFITQAIVKGLDAISMGAAEVLAPIIDKIVKFTVNYVFVKITQTGEKILDALKEKDVNILFYPVKATLNMVFKYLTYALTGCVVIIFLQMMFFSMIINATSPVNKAKSAGFVPSAGLQAGGASAGGTNSGGSAGGSIPIASAGCPLQNAVEKPWGMSYGGGEGSHGTNKNWANLAAYTGPSHAEPCSYSIPSNNLLGLGCKGPNNPVDPDGSTNVCATKIGLKCDQYGYAYDIYATNNTTVYAPAIGGVTAWNFSSLAGSRAILTSTDGQYKIYMAYLEGKVTNGQYPVGQAIAQRTTPQGTNTHVHVELAKKSGLLWVPLKPEDHLCN